MTTILLLKKFLSLKTSKTELRKIRNLKKRNMREMTETKRSLQKVIAKYKVSHRCRLCLRPAETNMFHNKVGINLADDIKSILNIEVRHNDGKPQHICEQCRNTVHKAIKLKQTAEVAQWRLQQEAELMSENVCDEIADDDTNIYEDEMIIYQDTVKRKQCQKVPKSNNVGENWKEAVNKPRCGPFICEMCGMELKNKSGLTTHMITHSNDFKYSCGYCPYRTRSSSSLRVHERCHTGDRPYACVQCQATFVSASNLASHRRTHLPPTLKCDICQKGFKFRRAVLNHIATQHRNARPFCCCDCGNSFSTRKMLRRHERKAHNRPKMRQGTIPSYIRSQNLDEKSKDES